MTGATGVHLLLWNDERQGWLLPRPDGRRHRPGRRRRRRRWSRSSVLRYVERTREPLLVDDATRDDRFARDPYFAAARLLLAAGRADPQPRRAAGDAAAGEPAHPRRVHRRTPRRRHAHRRPARRLARQRPAVRRVAPDRRRAGGAAAGGDPGRPGRLADRGLRRRGRRRSSGCWRPTGSRWSATSPASRRRSSPIAGRRGGAAARLAARPPGRA